MFKKLALLIFILCGMATIVSSLPQGQLMAKEKSPPFNDEGPGGNGGGSGDGYILPSSNII